MEISPEIQDISDRLMNQWGIMRRASPEFFVKAMQNAVEYRGCYLSFWRVLDGSMSARYLIVARNDRKPNTDEALPFLQTMFEDGNADILEVSQNNRTLEFVQSKTIYETQSLAEKMGDSLSDYADKKDEVEQFDFDKTSTAKRMNDAVQRDSL